jgi:hypothetical protein
MDQNHQDTEHKRRSLDERLPLPLNTVESRTGATRVQMHVPIKIVSPWNVWKVKAFYQKSQQTNLSHVIISIHFATQARSGRQSSGEGDSSIPKIE